MAFQHLLPPWSLSESDALKEMHVKFRPSPILVESGDPAHGISASASSVVTERVGSSEGDAREVSTLANLGLIWGFVKRISGLAISNVVTVAKHSA